MTQEIAKKEDTQLSMNFETQQEPVLRSDLIIPKVLLMQGLSERVSDRKAIQGDIVRSTTGEKLGDDKSPVSFIPLTYQNLWTISEDVKGTGSYEYKRTEPRTAANEDAPWDYVENGARMKRTKVLHVFALLVNDIETETAEIEKFKTTGELPNVDNVLFPVVIPFRSTGFNAGKVVVTHFKKAQQLSEMVGRSIPPYGTIMSLVCKQDKNDKGTYFVYEVESKGATPQKYIDTCEKWYKSLRSGPAIVHEVDLTETKEDTVAF